MPDWNWYYACGEDPENYTGPFDARDAMVAEIARTYCPGETVTLAEARPMALSDRIFTADIVFEAFEDHNSDLADPDGDSLLDGVTNEQCKELEEALDATFAAWRAKHSLGRAWALDIRNTEVWTVPEPAAAAVA